MTMTKEKDKKTALEIATAEIAIASRFREAVTLEGTDYQAQKLKQLTEAMEALPQADALRILAQTAANLPRQAMAFH